MPLGRYFITFFQVILKILGAQCGNLGKYGTFCKISFDITCELSH